MNNFTTNTYEMKRDILNFSKKITEGLDKPTTKFVSEMIYGIEKSNSILFSEIARTLKENIKLKNTIERLCDNCNALSNEELKIIKENYFNIALKQLPDEEIILIEDDSDVNKEYSNKLEDLCTIRDASSKEEKYVNGYHVCEIVGLSKNEYQPISLYSKIYSTETKGFKSCPNETMKSEKYVIEKIRKEKDSKIIVVKDRGYDSFELFKTTLENNVSFIVRLDGNRNLLFKGKKRLVSEVASRRKGKIQFSDLIGNKIYVAGEGSAEKLLLNLLEKNSIPVEEGSAGVEIVVKKSQMALVSEFVQKKADYVLVSEPAVSDIFNRSKNAKVAIDFQEQCERVFGYGKIFPRSVLVVRSSLIEDSPAEFKSFLSELEYSVQRATKKPREASRIVEKNNFGVNRRICAQAICGTKFNFFPVKGNFEL